MVGSKSPRPSPLEDLILQLLEDLGIRVPNQSNQCCTLFCHGFNLGDVARDIVRVTYHRQKSAKR
jgi:hypothetical protein